MSRDDIRAEMQRDIIDTPENAQFMAGVPIEGVHQRERSMESIVSMETVA